ncbi:MULTISPECIES: biopolymer transporter ExbD [unclassified Roseofilum]|uniref:ExbD/TolR family protein n=1 Tax=unclassified Roseofilum TaxID=2620099 RepID=UPI000E8E0E96|nr:MULTISPECIES: biopolymer transporter ExbD [unclassified Roseofilum]MBP0010987.1 biopolymer transporter ExbD [Roseofilum sp. Belize Diploria]MBP0035493.1 biopolymer transporter ExbD [Roseofilum sp. Belize BBD 4]HBQ99359.1 biopolymer transporter ExbD [Cyanobacteria bacterium UBA11691]
MRLVDDDPDLPPQINILPMIDAIFSILTFFMIGTLFLTRNEGLPVNLPEAGTGEVQQQERITVSINAQGKIGLDEIIIPLEQLDARVVQLMQGKSTQLVAIKADEAIAHKRVIEVMDRLRTIQGIRLAIATEAMRN